MPKYFFDVYDGASVREDDFGDHFTGLAEAADQAVGLIVDLGRESLSTTGDQDLAVMVRNDSGLDEYWASLMFRDSSSGMRPGSGGLDVPQVLRLPNPADIIQRSWATRSALRRDRTELEAVMDTVCQTLRETLDLMRPPGGKAAVA